MDAMTKMRLLLGATRPFLFGKLIESIRGKRRISLPDNGVDPRIQLERARMHEWAGGVSESELQAFMEAHPTTDPAMWAVAMDVGIRLGNMMQTGSRKSETGGQRIVLVTHARWVWEHLETSGGMATSHLIGGLYGLACACAACPDDPWLARIAPRVGQMLHAGMRTQILNDGMSFEASTAYHRHVVDILVQATAAMQQHPVLRGYLDTEWMDRLHKAVHALSVLEAAGMPLIGDNDDGMAVKLDSAYPGTPSTRHLYHTYEHITGRAKPEPPAIPLHMAYPDFGLDLWFRPRYGLTARCGALGQYGKGGHAHNDQNSITLRVDGESIVTDAGSFCYTANPVRRNRDRSTQSHSTVVSHLEQRAWPSGQDGLFWLVQSNPDPEVLVRGSGAWHGKVVHQNRHGFAHERRLAISDDRVDVYDVFGDGSQPASMVLMLAPGVQVHLGERSATLRAASTAAEVTWSHGSATVEPWEVAPAYGISTASTRMVIPITNGRLDWAITLPK
jgi:hypothetical protein